MAEQNPSTQPEEKAVEAPQTEAHQHAAGGAHAHTGSEKKQAIKEALKPQARRTSVVEDYSAELDEMASLTRALGKDKKDDETSQAWKKGYPYDTKLSRKAYEKEKRALQIELLKLQLWAKSTGQKILIIFEGRDAAGKGGSIKRFTEHLNPRGARVVALEKPTDIEQTQWYFQRYIKHLPSGGEIVLMDRSWYNRAGVERVMGYTDLASLDKWDDYTAAKEAMFFYTHTGDAPWTVIKSNDKKRARLEAMRYVLSQFDYPSKDEAVVGELDSLIVRSASHVFEDESGDSPDGFPVVK